MPVRTEWVLGDIVVRKWQFILTRENPCSPMPMGKWFYKKFEENHDGIAVKTSPRLYTKGSQHVRSRARARKDIPIEEITKVRSRKGES
jgi:hypothetical protein